MKKSSHNQNDLRPEYDFAAMKGGVRGNYVRRLREGTNIILLEPEIAEAFPNDQAVNQVIRGILDIARSVRSTGGRRDKALKRRGLRRK